MSTLTIVLIIELRMVSRLSEHILQSHHNNVLLMFGLNPSSLLVRVGAGMDRLKSCACVSRWIQSTAPSFSSTLSQRYYYN